MSCASFLNRLKDRGTQIFILWVIVIIAIIIIISVNQTAGALVGCLILVIVTLEFTFFNRYANYSTFRVSTFITVVIGYFLVLSTMVLLPLDLSRSVITRNEYDYNANEDSRSVFLICWTILYWGMFVLNNLIYKLQIIYDSAGHLNFSKKMLWTLKQFFRQILILIIIFAVACIILAAAFKIHGRETLQTSVLILVNVIGLMILVLLLGFGLVQFPWYIWTHSYPDYLIKCELSKSDDFFKKYREAQVELNEAAHTYQTVIEKIPKGHELYGYVQYLKDELPKLENLSQSFARTVGNEIKEKGKKDTKLDLKALENVNEDLIAAARTQLKLKTYNLEKFESKWNKHCEFIFSKSNLDLSNPEFPRNKEKLITTNIIAKEMSLGVKILYRILGLALLALSLLIMFSETTLVFGSNDNVLAFSQMVKNTGKNSLFLLIVVLVLATLSYLVFCAYFALFRMEIGIVFDLSVHQTHAITMMKSSTTCLNLAFPLCYNLMMLFNEVSPVEVIIDKNIYFYFSAFVDFFKPMRSVPFFGSNYNTIVPLFIALIGFFTAFKFFGRLIQRATKGLIAIEVTEMNPEKIAKGEKVVLAEWERRKRKLRQDEINVQRSERLVSSTQSQKLKEEIPKKPETRPQSVTTSIIVEKNKQEEKKESNDIENNPTLTTEQKEAIMQQESISKEIVKDIEFAGYDYGQKDDKPSEFEEIKGILSRKNKIGSWKECYFVVVGNSLCYYDNAKLNKKKGEFEVAKMKSVGEVNSKTKKNKGKKFMINFDKNQVQLKAKSPGDAQKWIAYLNYVIQMYQIKNI